MYTILPVALHSAAKTSVASQWFQAEYRSKDIFLQCGVPFLPQNWLNSKANFVTSLRKHSVQSLSHVRLFATPWICESTIRKVFHSSISGYQIHLTSVNTLIPAFLDFHKTCYEGKQIKMDWSKLKRCSNLFLCIERHQSEVTQSCLTLCDPVDCSPPGSSVHRILQARILEWVAISFSWKASNLLLNLWLS